MTLFQRFEYYLFCISSNSKGLGFAKILKFLSVLIGKVFSVLNEVSILAGSRECIFISDY